MSATLEDVVQMLRILATGLQDLEKHLAQIERDASELTDHFVLHHRHEDRKAALELWRGHHAPSR